MQELFRKYLSNQCSPEEVRLLLKKFETEDNKDLLRHLIAQELEDEGKSTAINEPELEPLLAGSYHYIRSQINFEKKTKTPLVSLVSRAWFRIAAAAIIIAAIVGAYLLMDRSPSEQPVSNTQTLPNDIAPGGNKASLTLADGSVIDLEASQIGKIALQGNTEISKSNDGQIVYTSSRKPSAEIFYNTITTPRGGQYQLTLADGSKAWLNSVSSIRYPDSFTGNEREVEINGEVYFEVVKNASMPFKIRVAGKQEVEVLGTHFNINSYTDETTINTTLLEGSIKVTATNSSFTAHSSLLLSSGQQAQLNASGRILIEKKADLDQVMAWKNGYFNWDGADTKAVMRSISRWYGVEVIYEGTVAEKKFGGEIGKDLNLSQVLTILEKNGLHFKLEGKKLTVLP